MLRRALAALTLALLLVATATACGSGVEDAAKTEPVRSSASTEPVRSSASAEPFVGTWTIESQTFPSGNTYTQEDLEEAGTVITLDVREDGTFDLSDGDRQTEDRWKPTGDTTATFWASKTPAEVTLDDGRLTLAIPDGPEMVFTRS